MCGHMAEKFELKSLKKGDFSEQMQFRKMSNETILFFHVGFSTITYIRNDLVNSRNPLTP